MKKRVFKIFTLAILVLLIIFLSLFLLQTTLLKRSITNKWLTAKETEFKEYDFVRCNWNIFKPEVAFVDDFILLQDIKGLEIHFYTQKNLFDFSRESWSESNWTGGTDVKNTTFPELLKMVKADCGQFQQGGRKGEIEWIHTPAPAQEEINKDKIDSLERIFYGLDEKARGRFIEIYGDIDTMPAEAKIVLHDSIEKDGLDPTVEVLRKAEETRKGLSELSENQQKAIRQRYGDWEKLSDDALLEWMKIIDTDYEEGKFNLDDY